VPQADLSVGGLVMMDGVQLRRHPYKSGSPPGAEVDDPTDHDAPPPPAPAPIKRRPAAAQGPPIKRQRPSPQPVASAGKRRRSPSPPSQDESAASADAGVSTPTGRGSADEVADEVAGTPASAAGSRDEEAPPAAGEEPLPKRARKGVTFAESPARRGILKKPAKAKVEMSEGETPVEGDPAARGGLANAPAAFRGGERRPDGSIIVPHGVEGAVMGKNFATSVRDKLVALAKKGNPQPLVEYRALKNNADKRRFAARLHLDRSACFAGGGLSVGEKESSSHTKEQGDKSGWLALWEVANRNISETFQKYFRNNSEIFLNYF